MATATSKINEAFIDIISKDKDVIRKINEAIVNEGLTPEEAVKKYDKQTNRDAMFYFIIAVLSIMANRPLTSKEKSDYAPIIAFTAIYNTQAPKLFAEKTNKILYNTKLSAKETQAKELLRTFIDKNRDVIRNIEHKIIDNRIKSHSQIYADVKAAKAPLYSTKKKELIKIYNDPKRVERALRTEAHAELEQGKFEHAKGYGYIYKVWKTRNDNRVRDTDWHNTVKDMKVELNKPFRAHGMHAMYPGDITLPMGERIRCRCYLIYE